MEAMSRGIGEGAGEQEGEDEVWATAARRIVQHRQSRCVCFQHFMFLTYWRSDTILERGRISDKEGTYMRNKRLFQFLHIPVPRAKGAVSACTKCV